MLDINICRSVLDPNFLPLDFKEFFIAVDNQRGYVAFEIEAVITENLNKVKLSWKSFQCELCNNLNCFFVLY